MILSFTVDKFEGLIKKGVKITTCRRNQGKRWKVGMSIEFYLGNPRKVSKNPRQFGTGVVHQVWDIKIDPYLNEVVIKFETADCNVTNYKALNMFALDEGFDSWHECKTWFLNQYGGVFEGSIIYWKNFAPYEKPVVQSLFN